MEYREPEIVTVADAQAATAGGPAPIAERPTAGYFDADKRQPEYPGELLDV